MISKAKNIRLEKKVHVIVKWIKNIFPSLLSQQHQVKRVKCFSFLNVQIIIGQLSPNPILPLVPSHPMTEINSQKSTASLIHVVVT